MADDEDDGPDFDRIGLFKEMSYLSPGSIYPERTDNEESFGRVRGRQMLGSGTQLKCGTQAGYFDPEFVCLETEERIDPIRQRRLERIKQAEKNIDPRGFKHTNPGKKKCGSGDYFGTFTERQGIPEYFSSQPRQLTEPREPLKNFYTNPGKRGTGYGYADVTIGKFPQYSLDEDTAQPGNENQPKEPVPFKPYRAGVYQPGYFNPNPYKVDEKCLEPKEEEQKEMSDEEDEEKKPFLRPNPAKKDGGMKAGCIGPYPEHTDGPVLKQVEIPRGIEEHVNSEGKMYLPMPVSNKPYPIKSVIATTVHKRVNPKNCKDIKGVVYCDK